MNRPHDITSGEAMAWNNDVERRRSDYHERRCAEDPIYRRVYIRQREQFRKICENNAKLQRKMAEIMWAAIPLGCHTDCMKAALQKASHQMENVESQPIQSIHEEDKKQIRSHDEIMLERSLMEIMDGGQDHSTMQMAFAFGMMGMMFRNPEEIKRRLEQAKEEQPYIDEIYRVDKDFDNKIIRMSGFEW